jgi:23S rRNA (cytosine1962-C5)-methyltransferase
MQSLPQVNLKVPKAFSHPWVFQKMVERPEGALRPKNGSVVDVLNPDGAWVARGLYNGHSRIAVRILTEDPKIHIDLYFFRQKIRQALALRQDVYKLQEIGNAYRLIHSEADGLSGLIVDVFGDTIVVEYFSGGMYRLRPIIEEALRLEFPKAQTIYYFSEEHVQKQESIDIRSPAPPKPSVIEEHGLKFWVKPGSKHKTGFFVDQRTNRHQLAQLVKSTKASSLLDICCNSGGFAVYAKSALPSCDVTALDLDEEVLKLAADNAKLNNVKINFVQSDLFPWLREVQEKGKTFDIVILDPSKQTRSKETVNAALKKYCDMNRLAMQVVKPGGILLTCSCTGLISESEFLESIRRAAFQSKRTVQIFQVTGADVDHPFRVNVPESRYLKAVWCRVL